MTQSQDGKVLALPNGLDVALFEVQTGKRLRTLRGKGPVLYSAFSPDCRLVAASSPAAGATRVWEVGTGETLCTLTTPDNHLPVAFSPDGKRLFTSFGPGRIQVWDARSGQQLHVLQGHTAGGWGRHPDGKRLASSDGQARTVTIWDWDGDYLTEVRTSEVQPANAGGPGVPCYSPDGKLLACRWGFQKGVRTSRITGPDPFGNGFSSKRPVNGAPKLAESLRTEEKGRL
jgi:WD40 repeat protein